MHVKLSYMTSVRNLFFIFPLVAMALTSLAQSADLAGAQLSEFDKALSFEVDKAGSAPTGWTTKPAGAVLVDDKLFHSGQHSVRIELKAGTADGFGVITKSLPLEFSGKVIELHGFLRTENVTGFAGLWMREDMDGNRVEYDNMQSRQLKGTTDWTEYIITLPVHPGAQKLLFGAIAIGSGKVWVDDLQLLVDGKPPSQAPKEDNSSVIEKDHQFDGGSGIALPSLTQIQIDNLAMLGKVWGFLKYEHPLVTSGKFHWDYELFRILPAILAAPDRTSAQLALVHWINGLGTIQPCNPCAVLDEKEVQLRPDVGWIADETLLGKDLVKILQFVHQNRLPEKQFYVSLAPGVKNPLFEHEQKYEGIKFPDAGFQILALYRFWNIIEYWSPNRNIVGEDWNGMLREFLPRIALAKTSDDYQLQMMAMIALDHDTHANLWSSLKVRPPVGECMLPLNLRFIGHSAVIYSFASVDTTATDGFKVGDVITDLDGHSVEDLVRAWTPFYADSNQAARLRDIAQAMTNGSCGSASIGLRRGTESLTVKATRIPVAGMTAISSTHDLPGETFRLLTDQVAYLKLSSAKIADVDHYFQLAEKTKGLIVDIRNYPSEFVAYALGSHLVVQPTLFARITTSNLSSPGEFHWDHSASLQPSQPHYAGKVILLIDEISQSQAEFTAMALRSSPNAVVIGSTTSGADGNMSQIPLPGGLSSAISGTGVFYPDGKPTQQIGIVPDKTFTPTIEGISAGRDEVLEEAVRQILGAEMPPEAIDHISKP